ncbi:MAG: UDP-3-O-(3-hydroxymyristoyl)glucosamine N-acyltransferase [Sulfurimonadaceae bacterium]|jgi:UDP-3-O-[3-hydroxymyristoyl] glucosamine N-acyltransferase|nr:UDP-3-O-(3-hydroxymyristoyl)glucosamine N-acyltransferase [Sulfurimonadaceae bacterium]
MDIKTAAQIIGAEFNGENFKVSGMNTLKDATKTQISFISNAKYSKDIENTNAGAVIVTEAGRANVPQGCIALVVANPYWEMATLSKYFAPPIEDNALAEPLIGEGSTISPKAEIANGAVIGNNCTIMAGAYVGAKTIIGDNTILYSNVVVYRDCKIGSNCIIHANTTIGSDGFGFATDHTGVHKKIYQNGNVVIEDDVEIGSSVAIDRAVFGSTLVKQGVHIDNLVQVGHNCEIGAYSVMVSQSGLAGSTKLGRNVVMGGQSAASGHLSIAPFNTFAARSGITKDITGSGGTYAGFPLMEHRLWLKLQGKIARLLK